MLKDVNFYYGTEIVSRPPPRFFGLLGKKNLVVLEPLGVLD